MSRTRVAGASGAMFLSMFWAGSAFASVPVKVGPTARITVPAGFCDTVAAGCGFVVVDQDGALAGNQIDVASYQNGSAADVMTEDTSLGAGVLASIGASQTTNEHGTVQGGFLVQGRYYAYGERPGDGQVLWTPRFNAGAVKSVRLGGDEGIGDGHCGLITLPASFAVPGITFVDQDATTPLRQVEGYAIQGLGAVPDRVTLQTDDAVFTSGGAPAGWVVLGRTGAASADGRLDGRCFNVDALPLLTATVPGPTRRAYVPKYNNGTSSGFDYVALPGKMPVDPDTMPGVVAFWRGQGSAADELGTHSGAVNAGVGYAAGRIGQAFAFDGLTGSVEVPFASDLDDFSTSFTMALWVKGGASNTMDCSIDCQSLLATPSYGIEISPGNDFVDGANVSLRTNSSGGVVYWSDANGGGYPLAATTWYHLATTYDGSAVRLFVNGLEVGNPQQVQGSILSMRRSDRLSIGSGAGKRVAGELFDGLVDDVVVFSRALSAEEIQGLYQRSSGGL